LYSNQSADFGQELSQSGLQVGVTAPKYSKKPKIKFLRSVSRLQEKKKGGKL
jgi:hypothetical protein